MPAALPFEITFYTTSRNAWANHLRVSYPFAAMKKANT